MCIHFFHWTKAFRDSWEVQRWGFNITLLQTRSFTAAAVKIACRAITLVYRHLSYQFSSQFSVHIINFSKKLHKTWMCFDCRSQKQNKDTTFTNRQENAVWNHKLFPLFWFLSSEHFVDRNMVHDKLNKGVRSCSVSSIHPLQPSCHG